MKKYYFFSFSVLGIVNLLWSMPLLASDMVPVQSHYYYDLGGGSDFTLPPVQTTTTLRIGGDINTDLGFNCGAFNPGVSITNSLNNAEDTVEGLPEDIIASATGAVVALPMYVLEKSSPELYNLLQNTIASANETFKRCRPGKRGTSRSIVPGSPQRRMIFRRKIMRPAIRASSHLWEQRLKPVQGFKGSGRRTSRAAEGILVTNF